MDDQFADYLLRKTEEDYDRMASDFSVTRAFPWAETRELVDHYIESGDRVLDAGCGNGRLYELLRDKKVSYEGIDTSAKLVEIARERYGNFFAKHNLVDLHQFPKNSFSVIFCVATFQHVPGDKYRRRVLADFNQLLLPGGLLLMTNWNVVNQPKFKPYLQRTRGVLGMSKFDRGDLLFPWKATSPTIYRYYHGFTEAEMAELLCAGSFALEEQYYTAQGKRADAATGYNLITVARKSQG